MSKSRKRKEQKRALKRAAVENAVFEILWERGMIQREPRNYRQLRRLVIQEKPWLTSENLVERHRQALDLFGGIAATLSTAALSFAKAVENINLAGVSTEELKHD